MVIQPHAVPLPPVTDHFLPDRFSSAVLIRLIVSFLSFITCNLVLCFSFVSWRDCHGTGPDLDRGLNRENLLPGLVVGQVTRPPQLDRLVGSLSLDPAYPIPGRLCIGAEVLHLASAFIPFPIAPNVLFDPFFHGQSSISSPPSCSSHSSMLISSEF